MQRYEYLSSDGIRFDLRKRPYYLESAEPFYSYEREVKTGNEIINGFTSKGVYTRKVTISVTESEGRTAQENLEALLASFETDVYAQEPGRIYIGDYYLSCYAYAGTFLTRMRRAYAVETVIVTDNNKWYREVASYEITNAGVSQAIVGDQSLSDELRDTTLPITTPFGYPNPANMMMITNPCVLPCHFRLTYRGAWTNPAVTIGGQVYALTDLVLGNGESATINSMLHTIKKNDGTSLFAKRDLDHDCFERLPTGELTVLFTGDHSLNLTLVDERQMPVAEI